MNPRLRWAAIAGLLALAVLAPALPRPGDRLLAAAVRALCGLLALAAVEVRRRRNPEERPVWALAEAGLALFIAGDLLALVAFSWPGVFPVPEWASTLLLHLLPIPFFVAALLRWSGQRPPRPDTSAWHAGLDGLLFGYAAYYLIWVVGIRHWQGATRASEASASLVFRFVLLGILLGLCVYHGSRNPARWKGPLAWFGGAFLLLTVASAFSTASMLGGRAPWLRMIASVLKPAALLLLAGAAWSRGPLEPSRESDRDSAAAVAVRDHLPYLPAALATLGAILLVGPRSAPIDPQVLVYGAPVVALLLVRQFLAFQALKAFSRNLESMVQARTRALEAAQGVAMRTERMNALAMLGAGLAHDLNNSLAAIRATVELVAEDAAGGKPCATSDLDRLLVASDQAAGLARRMMTFGREDVPATVVDLREELQRCEDLLRILLPRRILLRLAPGDAPCPVATSRSHLEQILVNLVGNARDAIDDAGVITIELRADEDGAACLRVQDSGCGIPEEAIARIFDPFFTTKPEGRGTGLGLPSVKALVERDAGRIEVQSQPGLGTVFTLRFPRAG